MRRRTVQDPRDASTTEAGSPVRGTVARFAVALAMTAIGVGFASANPAEATTGAAAAPTAATAPAQEDCADGVVNVIEVDGLLDTVLADFVDDEVDEANGDGCVRAVVLQLDTGGATLSEGRVDELVAALETSEVPGDVWGVAPGSSIEVTPALLDARGVAPADLGDVDVGDRIGHERAVELDLVDNDAPVLGEFVVGLPDVESEAVEGGRQPLTEFRFASLGIVGQLMHTVASPPVAYLLFVIGLTLLLFELYTAGVGVAGVTGAGLLLLGSYGLVALPTRPIGVALLLLAMFAYGVDVQTGVPRVWTGIGTVAFVVGSLVLYDGVSVSWVTLLIAFVGITLTMLAGMPTMVRTRFSTPTIGREWMVGEMGSARTDIDPDGVVSIRDAPWRDRPHAPQPLH